jgi:hypothetical protein
MAKKQDEKPRPLPKAKPKAKPSAPQTGRRPWLLILATGVLVALGLVLAFDVERVTEPGVPPWLQSGDLVLLDRLSAELGWVRSGEVVELRGRGAAPSRALRQVAASEGEPSGAKLVERGHLALVPKDRSEPEPIAPVADVVAVGRLRIRRAPRWALDLLP